MILLKSDIAKITKLGYELNYFAVRRGGFYFLRNIKGHCIFLDPLTKRCKIYSYRPLGCRLYPVVYYVDSGEVGVDPECPLALEVTRDELFLAKRIMRRVILKELGFSKFKS